jgi:SAM-dependent methyltransferase
MSDAAAHPDFWNIRYDAGRTPWDGGGVPAPLARWLAAHPGRGARVLLPGCGTGWEVAAFAAAGWAVTALDFSPPAVTQARARLGPALAACVALGDFFTHEFSAAPFDLVYERTFLCALPPGRWSEIAARTATLLRPGGLLAGIYFFGDKEDGPPFGLADDEPAQLFAPGFALVADHPIPADESLPLFAGRERWQERRRT